MAYASASASGTSVTGKINDLTYVGQDYNFIFTLYKSNGTYVTKYTEMGCNWWDLHYATHTFTGLDYSTSYYVKVLAKHTSGNWPFTSGTVTTGAAPVVATPRTSNLSVSVTSVSATSITFYRTGWIGSLSTKVIKNGVKYSLDGSGYTYTVSGDYKYLTFTNLNPNTKYEIRCYDITASGTWWYDYWQYTNDVSKPNAPTIEYKLDGGYRLKWNSVPGATHYQIKFRNYDGVDRYTCPTTNTYIDLTGLEYGISYYLSVQALYNYDRINNWADSLSGFSSENTGTTAPKTPTLNTTNNSTSITATLKYTMSGNWDYIKVWYRQTDTSTWYYKQFNNPSSSVAITGLTSNTTYEIKASSFFYVNGTTLESVDYSPLITITLGGRPDNFSWTSNISKGTKLTVSGTNVIILTAAEWNSFTAKINAFRNYKGYGNYAFTTVSKNTKFTAAIFNEARNAINAMSPPTPVHSSTTSGVTKIDSWILTKIKDSLNSIP